jgi:hypothetical protein
VYLGLKNELVDRLANALNPESGANAEQATDANDQEDENMDVGESKTNEIDKLDDNSQQNQDMEVNMAEMDMSEVTIIDEYDSTKCDEQEEKSNQTVNSNANTNINNNNKKRVEPKKMDEKERNMWEKRYQLPVDSPCVIVHPSRTAKSGKFDCAVVSLSLLLDYRKDDTKEHSFEISLFAEAFNEMLMRDFGFNIYKAFNYCSITKAKESSKEDDKKKEGDNATTTSTSSSSIVVDVDAKKSRHDDSDDQSDQSRKRMKYVTAYPNLLLSFNYFDQTQCGYIFEKDIEDLFYTLGLNLSRSQVRKLTEKFITRDSLYYRKITDRQVDAPFVDAFENVSAEQVAQLAHGNVVARKSNEAANEISQSNEIVTINGTTINVQQILIQMKRTETAYEESEKLLVELRKSNGELKSANHKNEKRIKDLNSDLKSVTRKLQDAESSLSSVTVKK